MKKLVVVMLGVTLLSPCVLLAQSGSGTTTTYINGPAFCGRGYPVSCFPLYLNAVPGAYGWVNAYFDSTHTQITSGFILLYLQPYPSTPLTCEADSTGNVGLSGSMTWPTSLDTSQKYNLVLHGVCRERDASGNVLFTIHTTQNMALYYSRGGGGKGGGGAGWRLAGTGGKFTVKTP